MKERIVLFTAHSKLILRCLPFLLSIVLFCFPLNVNAAVGVGSVWDGTFSFNFPTPLVYIDYSRVHQYNTNSAGTTTTGTYTVVTYEGSNNGTITITSNETDVYLNGTFNIRVELSPQYNLNTGAMLNISCNPIILDNVFVNVMPVSRGSTGTTSFDIIIQFDNYYVNQSTITLPIMFDLTLNAFYNTLSNTASVFERIGFLANVVSDYHGTIMQYDNLEDVPSIDGYMSEQNTQIINNTTLNNDLLQQQIQQDHQDTLDQTNELTNGYQSSLVGSAENDFNAGAGQLTGIEDTLSNSSTQYVNTFTSTGFDDSLLDSIAPSMQYVVTWFTNFWNMGGALTKCFTLCFALYIAFFILRVRS